MVLVLYKAARTQSGKSQDMNLEVSRRRSSKQIELECAIPDQSA